MKLTKESPEFKAMNDFWKTMNSLSSVKDDDEFYQKAYEQEERLYAAYQNIGLGKLGLVLADWIDCRTKEMRDKSC